MYRVLLAVAGFEGQKLLLESPVKQIAIGYYNTMTMRVERFRELGLKIILEVPE